jgi:hypothetical protein
MGKRATKIILFFFTSIILISTIQQFSILRNLEAKENQINNTNLTDLKSATGKYEWFVDMNNGFSIPYDMATDKYGNIYITGQMDVYGETSGDFFLSKYNNSGMMIWNITSKSPFFDVGRCLYIDKYDFLYVGGFVNNPFGTANILMKFNLNGGSIMNISMDPNMYSTREATAIDIDERGNIYLGCKASGESNNEPNEDFFIFKFDKQGNYLWHKKWGGKGFELLKSLKLDSLNNIYVAGRTNSIGNGGTDAYIAKLTSKGKMIWSKTLGNEKDDGIEAIQFNKKEELICTGYIGAATIAGEVLKIRMTKNGILKEVKKWGGPKGFDIGVGTCIDKRNNLHVYGRSYTKTFGAFIIKFNQYGKFLGWKNFPDIEMEEIVDMIPDLDGSFLIYAMSNRFQESNELYLFKYKINSFTTLQGEMTRYTKIVNRFMVISKDEVMISLIMSLILVILFFGYFLKGQLYIKMGQERKREQKLQKINKIKKGVIDMSTKFTRLKLEEIISKIGIYDEKLVETTLKNMIKNQEVYGEYFSMSKSIVFEQKTNIAKINDLLSLYESWEKDKLNSLN